MHRSRALPGALELFDMPLVICMPQQHPHIKPAVKASHGTYPYNPSQDDLLSPCLPGKAVNKESSFLLGSFAYQATLKYTGREGGHK